MKALDEEVKKILKEVDWHALIPEVLTYARMHLYRTRAYKLYPLAWKVAEDYLNEAITLFLSGAREWNYKDVTLSAFLIGTVRSLISHDIQKSLNEIKRRVELDSESVAGVQSLDELEKDIADAETTEILSRYLQNILERDYISLGIVDLVIRSDIHKPRDLAAILGVSVDEIYKAKKRLSRALAHLKKDQARK